MSEQFWTKFIEQSPGICGVVVIVIMFLWFLLHQSKVQRARDKDQNEAYRRIIEDCHDAHERIVDKNNSALERNNRVLDRSMEALGFALGRSNANKGVI